MTLGLEAVILEIFPRVRALKESTQSNRMVNRRKAISQAYAG